MLENLFKGLFDTDLTAVISVTDFLLCLGASLVIGILMAFAYMYRTRYTKSFVVTLALLPAVSEEYREEQKVIKEKIPQLKKEIEELTPEILRTFISKIIIHERAQKRKKTSEQQIDIYFQYIGSIPETPIEKAG